MIQVTFRAMTPADIDSVAALEEASFSMPWSRQTFEAELLNPLACYEIMEESGTLAGYAGMWIIIDEAHIMNVAVMPACRGRGLGSALMRHTIQAARDKGAERMTLEVRTSNYAARHVYGKLGFAEKGVRPGYYTDTGEDALLLWLDDLSAAESQK